MCCGSQGGEAHIKRGVHHLNLGNAGEVAERRRQEGERWDAAWQPPLQLSHPTARQKSRRKPLVITVTTNAWRGERGNLSIKKWCRDESTSSSFSSHAHTHGHTWTRTHTHSFHISSRSSGTTASERKSLAESHAFSAEHNNNVFSS